VTFGTDEIGDWLEVEDTGIGMSAEVLAGPLVDFGASYWDSALMLREFPSLLGRGFQATGRFGIGFFSVFMVAARVRVTTRRHDAAQADTRVLEFRRGLEGRPLLRIAAETERMNDGGTQVRIWMNDSPSKLVKPLLRFWESYSPRVLSAEVLAGHAPAPLAREEDMFELFCAWLCPALDVHLCVQRRDGTLARVVAASDWLTLEPRRLVLRTYGLSEPWSEEMRSVLQLADERMRFVQDDEPIYGRACLPAHESWLTGGGVVCAITAGGIRIASWPGVVGIMTGVPRTVARNEARLEADPSMVGCWATEQGVLAQDGFADESAAASYASQVAALGGNPKNIPFAQFHGEWVSCSDIRSWTVVADEYLVVYASLFDGVNLEGVPVELPDEYDDVFIISATSRTTYLLWVHRIRGQVLETLSRRRICWLSPSPTCGRLHRNKY
jgi:hypothetical protein